MSKPGISNVIREVARRAHDPTDRPWGAVQKILNYLKGTRISASHSAEILPTSLKLSRIRHTTPVVMMDDQLPVVYLS